MSRRLVIKQEEQSDLALTGSEQEVIRIVPPEDGWYDVHYMAECRCGSADGSVFTQGYINNAAAPRDLRFRVRSFVSSGTMSDDHSVTISTVCYLKAGEPLVFKAYEVNSGSIVNAILIIAKD